MSLSGKAFRSVTLHTMDAELAWICGAQDAAINLLDWYDRNQSEVYDLLAFCWQHHINYLNKGVCWLLCKPETGDEERLFLWLDFPMVLRQSESDPSQFRVEIVGDKLGSGNFGAVYRSLGMFVPNSQGAVYYDESSRVVKAQDHHDWFPIEDAINEVRLARQAGYLHMKHLIMNKNKKSFAIMRYMEGMNLHHYLQDDEAIFTTDQRLKIALNALFSVKEQIHDRHIVSRDLKPENMLICPETLQITNIDFGLAKRADLNDKGEKVGTGAYMSPEMRSRAGSDYYTDIYALGLVLSEIFAARPQWADESELEAKQRPILFKELFRDMADLSPADQEKIRKLLCRMTADLPRNRCSLMEAVHVLERILLKRQCELLDDEHKKYVQNGYHCGLLLREFIDPPLLFDMAGMQQDGMTVLVQHLNNNRALIIETLQDHPLAVKQFVQTIRSQLLSSCVSRQDVINKLDYLTSEFTRKMKLTTEVIEKLVSELVTAPVDIQTLVYPALMGIQRAIDARFKKTAPTIDNLPVITAKLDKLSQELACLIKNYNQALTAKEAGNPSVAGFFRISPIQQAREARYAAKHPAPATQVIPRS